MENVKKLRKTADKIYELMEGLKNMSDEELKKKTEEFELRLNTGETMDKLLPEAYAVVGEAAFRTLGLRPYKVQFMGATALHHGRVVEQYTGEGKAVTLDTRMPTPDGWKTAGDIKVGDMVFGRDGKPTKILGVFPQGKKKVHTVVLKDGRSVETADEHLWSVYEDEKARNTVVMNTEDLMMAISTGRRYWLPVNKEVEYPERDFEVPPYVMGAFLARRGEDGHVRFGKDDMPTLSNAMECLDFDKWLDVIKSMNGRIPEEYRTASVEQRWELMQGFFDAGVDNIGPGLRFDILEVLWSLGISTGGLNRIEIEKIEESDREEDMVCFTVEAADHLFLCGDYVVTHNTLVAAMPAYLNALGGKGVHVVTVNDYLAKRDAEEIGKIHEFLGLSVGCVLKTTSAIQKKEEYAKDITYITNTELGFDYLRDNMAQRAEDRMQRGYNYCIIDEVDSVLIDEARTPLIISGVSGKSTKLYVACNELVQTLEKGERTDLSKVDILAGERPEETGDYVVDEEHHLVTLTVQGIKKCEEYFGIDNLSDAQHTELMHNINAALRAHNLMKKDKDYVVKNGEVLIVDSFTGRIMPGRRYSDGIHQAIEAKEGVKINEETCTHATVTYQNFFNKYKKKCGMTGTGYTEKKEFKEIYDMSVVKIPTNKPKIRDDRRDKLFADKESKFRAVISEVKKSHAQGQPVLVGTSTIRDSEILDKMMKEEGLPHTVLNAKFLEKEAEIVSKAGEHGAITIATNMAGRGTDIKLDDISKEAGGLKVIGTQRHESRRIDNQLKGRSGRQGDPGESVFYISLDDDILRLYGSEKMRASLAATVNALAITEDAGVDGSVVDKFVKKAQTIIEDNNFGARKNVLKFDKVNNEQRELIYADRNAILDKADTRSTMLGMIEDCVTSLIGKGNKMTGDEYESIRSEIERLIPGIIVPEFDQKRKKFLKEVLAAAVERYEQREKEWPDDAQFREFERRVLLRCIDARWMQHINDLEILRQNISLVGYGQKDPTVVYKLKAFDMYNKMSDNIKFDAVNTLFSVQLKKAA